MGYSSAPVSGPSANWGANLPPGWQFSWNPNVGDQSGSQTGGSGNTLQSDMWGGKSYEEWMQDQFKNMSPQERADWVRQHGSSSSGIAAALFGKDAREYADYFKYSQYDPTREQFAERQYELGAQEIGSQEQRAKQLNELLMKRLAGESQDVRQSIVDARNRFGFQIEDVREQGRSAAAKTGFAGSGAMARATGKEIERINARFGSALSQTKSRYRDIGLRKAEAGTNLSYTLEDLQRQLQGLGLQKEQSIYGYRQNWLQDIYSLASQIEGNR